MNCTDIQNLLQDPDTENASVEFKSSAFLEGDEHHIKLCKEITGISNSGGGYLLIGITPDKQFEGKDIFANPDDVKGLISDLLRDIVSPQINCQIAFVPCLDGDVIAIEIPPKGDAPHAVVKRKRHEIESRCIYIRNDHGLQLVDDITLAGLYRKSSTEEHPEIDSIAKETVPQEITVNFSPKITIDIPESQERKRQRNARIIEIGILIAFAAAIFLSTLFHNLLWLSILWSVAEGVCFLLSIYIFTQAASNQKIFGIIIDLVIPLLPIVWGIMVTASNLIVIGWISTAGFWSMLNVYTLKSSSKPRRNAFAQLSLIVYVVFLVISSYLILYPILMVASEIVAVIIAVGYFVRYGIPYIIMPAFKFIKKAANRGSFRRQIRQLQQEMANIKEQHHVLYAISQEYKDAQARLNVLLDKLNKFEAIKD